MQLPLGLVLNGIDVFLLIFVRMTGLFVVAPIFGRRNVPAYMKIGFSFMTALILVNTVAMPDPEQYKHILQFVFLVGKEFLVGLTLGYVAYAVLTAIYVAGEILDMQIGFGVVNVIDPISNIQVPLSSNLYFIISMLVFLAVNGHHMLIKALFDSFTTVPLGTAVLGDNLLGDMLKIFGEIFIIGFKIAAPVTAAILIADVALGAISRMVPQLNIFVVGMPLKIIIGIALMMMTIPMFIVVLEALFNGMNGHMGTFIRDIAPK